MQITTHRINFETRNNFVGYCNRNSKYLSDCQRAFMLLTNEELYLENIFEIYRTAIFNIADTFEQSGITFWDDSYNNLKIAITKILQNKFDEAYEISYLLMINFLKLSNIFKIPNGYKIYIKIYKKEIKKYKEICSYITKFSLENNLETILYQLAFDACKPKNDKSLKIILQEYKEVLIKLGLSHKMIELEMILNNKSLALTKQKQ